MSAPHASESGSRHAGDGNGNGGARPDAASLHTYRSIVICADDFGLNDAIDGAIVARNLR